MFSVADHEEANDLLVMCCPTTADGKFYARELAQEQTPENLEAFSERIDRAHDRLMQIGKCRCEKKGAKER